MTGCDEQSNKIKKLTLELLQISHDKDKLSDPEVLEKSQELDRLIIEYYKLYGKKDPEE